MTEKMSDETGGIMNKLNTILYDDIDVDLESCPFCGEKVKTKDTMPMMWIHCDNCNVRMLQEYNMQNRFRVRDELAERWNRRSYNEHERGN